MKKSKKAKHTVIYFSKAQPHATCELCGKTDELRPYGPNGEAICFDCGMKDEPTTARKFSNIFKR